MRKNLPLPTHHVEELTGKDFRNLDSAIIDFILEVNLKKINPSPYSDFYFLDAWLTSFSEEVQDSRLYILRNIDTNQVCAIFPLKLERRNKVDQYKPWGVMFGYPQPLIDSTCSGRHLKLLYRHIKNKHRNFVIDFGPSKINWFPIIDSNAANEFFVSRHLTLQRKLDSPCINLSQDNFPVSSGLSQTIRTAKNRLTRELIVTNLFFNASNLDLRRLLLKKYREIHLNRWINSNFKKNEFCEFNNILFEKTSNDKLISYFELNSNISAIALGIIKDETYYLFGICFDDSFKKYSPGVLLIEYIVKYLQMQGIKYFDFMNNLEDYKLKWTDNVQPRFQYTLHSNFVEFTKFRLVLTKDKLYIKLLPIYLRCKNKYINRLFMPIILFRKI